MSTKSLESVNFQYCKEALLSQWQQLGPDIMASWEGEQGIDPEDFIDTVCGKESEFQDAWNRLDDDAQMVITEEIGPHLVG